MKILEIKNLEVSVETVEGNIKILRNVNLSIEENEVVGLVGESGCGKTMTGRAIMKLLPSMAKIDKGEIFLEKKDIVKVDEKEMRRIRGGKVSMIFQEPSSYLNPVFTVGSQIEEAIKGVKNKKERREKVYKILEEVDLGRNIYFRYPHQLSGGMQQRVMIGISLINNPSLLIADEPTTALDITTGRKIIELLKKLMNLHRISILFITHDISLSTYFSDRIAVMYAGRIVEVSPSYQIFKNPLHPYTERLIACLPERYKKGEKIKVIEGEVPDFRNLPSGCPFNPRCPYKMEICKEKEPEMRKIGESIVRCFKYGNIMENRKS